MWRMCSGCSAQIAAADARELARDRRKRRIWGIHAAVMFAILLALLGLRRVSHVTALGAAHAPRHPAPSISAPPR
jgi:hypothetical protein